MIMCVFLLPSSSYLLILLWITLTVDMNELVKLFIFYMDFPLLTLLSATSPEQS